MDSGTKAVRKLLYKQLSISGASDWAIDLETYHDSPKLGLTWPDAKLGISLGADSLGADGARHGNWTTLNCNDPAAIAANARYLTSAERWGMLDVNDAWEDVVAEYKTYDRVNKVSFSQSIARSINGPPLPECGIVDDAICSVTKTCGDMWATGIGPAGSEIWNSMVLVHNVSRPLSPGSLPAT